MNILLNENIVRKYPLIRLVDDNKSEIISSDMALEIAKEKETDLILISENSNPPICKICDYDKFVYNQKKSEKKNKQNKVKLKEMQLKMVTDKHDLEIKSKKVKEWLGDGNKVKIILKLFGRELGKKEMGEKIILNFIEMCGNIMYDIKPQSQGNNFISIIRKQ